MASVLLVWLLTALVATFWGHIVFRAVAPDAEKKSDVSWFILFWLGLAALNTGLNLWCFFFPLSAGAKAVFWLILLLWPAIQFSKNRKHFLPLLHNKFHEIQPIAWLPVLCTTGIALLKASGKPEIFDEGAYHLPLIRMWETKGLVIGMANLNGHYGLHSGWHILSAFCNLDFIPGWRLTLALNGLLAAILSLGSGVSMSRILKKQGLISDWIMAFIPFFLFRNVLSSPSTDIPAIAGTWFLFFFWLREMETKSDIWKSWPVFLVMPVWIFTIKASSVGLLMVPAGLLIWSLAKRDKRKAILVLASGLVLAIPWCIQNWLISGYLIFPVEITALFSPDWQVPAFFVQKKFYPEQFGAFAPPDIYNLAWLHTWFRAHNPDTHIILILSCMGMALGLTGILLLPAWKKRQAVFLYATLMASLIIWLLTVTEPRYGFGALVFSALFPIAVSGNRLSGKWNFFRFGVAIVIGLQGFMLWKTIKENQVNGDILIKPAEIPVVACRQIQLRNFKASIPVAYLSEVPAIKPVFCWDCPFPCFPKESINDSSYIEKGSFAGKEMYKSLSPE